MTTLRISILVALALTGIQAQEAEFGLSGGITATGVLRHSNNAIDLNSGNVASVSFYLAPQAMFDTWWLGGGITFNRVVSSPTVYVTPTGQNNAANYRLSISDEWKPGIVANAGKKLGDMWGIQFNFNWLRIRSWANAYGTGTAVNYHSDVNQYQFLGGFRVFLTEHVTTDYLIGPVVNTGSFAYPSGAFYPNSHPSTSPRVAFGASASLGFLF